MKTFYSIFVVIVVLAACGVVFFSILGIVQRGFKSNQELKSNIKSSELKDQQKKLIEDTEFKRKMLMEQQQQRLRDHQRRR